MPRTATAHPSTATRSPLTDPLSDPHAELDRQLDVLVDAGVPAAAGVSAAELRRRVQSLHDVVEQVEERPFVLVLPDLVPGEVAVGLTRLRGKTGFTTMEPDDLARFRPTADVDLPGAQAYLSVEPDTGRTWLDVPPEQVLPSLLESGRTPLTLDEGLALLLQDGEVLRRDTCFSMLAARCGDRRVPALWVSKGRPRLGWCWDGAPHTWLGSGSAAYRLG
jgi:Family of unknown function (DUF5701)